MLTVTKSLESCPLRKRTPGGRFCGRDDSSSTKVNHRRTEPGALNLRKRAYTFRSTVNIKVLAALAREESPGSPLVFSVGGKSPGFAVILKQVEMRKALMRHPCLVQMGAGLS